MHESCSNRGSNRVPALMELSLWFLLCNNPWKLLWLCEPLDENFQVGDVQQAVGCAVRERGQGLESSK